MLKLVVKVPFNFFCDFLSSFVVKFNGVLCHYRCWSKEWPMYLSVSICGCIILISPRIGIKVLRAKGESDSESQRIGRFLEPPGHISILA